MYCAMYVHMHRIHTRRDMDNSVDAKIMESMLTRTHTRMPSFYLREAVDIINQTCKHFIEIQIKCLYSLLKCKGSGEREKKNEK